MTKKQPQKIRCAIYTRKSSEEGLEQEFNSLHVCISISQSILSASNFDRIMGVSIASRYGGQSWVPIDTNPELQLMNWLKRLAGKEIQFWEH